MLSVLVQSAAHNMCVIKTQWHNPHMTRPSPLNENGQMIRPDFTLQWMIPMRQIIGPHPRCSRRRPTHAIWQPISGALLTNKRQQTHSLPSLYEIIVVIYEDAAFRPVDLRRRCLGALRDVEHAERTFDRHARSILTCNSFFSVSHDSGSWYP